MKNIKLSKAGKKGADKTWAKRNETISQLSAYHDKEFQNKILKWPTKYLDELLRHFKNMSN